MVRKAAIWSFLALFWAMGCTESPTEPGADTLSPETVADESDFLPCGGPCPETVPFCDAEMGQCVGCRQREDCRDDQQCVAGFCQAIICTPGVSFCSGNVLKNCNALGTAYGKVTCPGPCVVDTCEECVANTKGCDGGNTLVCEQGAWQVSGTCSYGEVCFQGECLNCVPESAYCKNGDVFRCVLGEDGQTYEGIFEKDCDTGTTGEICDEGQCTNHCAVNEKFNTTIGCAYWAVDLDNAEEEVEEGVFVDASKAQYAVIVSNPSDAFVATVRVFHQGEELDVQKVPPLQLVTFPLPDLELSGSSTGKYAYRIESNSPITAYQFNPLDNVDVFSNDASLLLPENSLGTEYRVMTRGQSQEGHRGYLAVVASEVGKTKVLVEPTADVAQGAGAPAIAKGASQEFILDQGEILTLETASFGGDLTGTRIRAEKRVAVFGGAEAANVPNTQECLDGACVVQGWVCETDADCPVTCCADHLEQQLPPVQTWGRQFLASRTQPRGLAKDTWRIVAREAGTRVSTVPFQGMIPELAAGEFFEFESDEDFMIEATQPILVGQFLASQNAPDPNTDRCEWSESELVGEGWYCIGFLQDEIIIPCQVHTDCPNREQADDALVGDPAFSLLVPYEQFSSTYVFLVPEGYESNYVNVVSPVGADIEVSGVELNTTYFTPMGNGLFQAGRIAIKPGVHRLVSDVPLGATVYGWSPFVSFAYPAGQALDVLVFE